MNRHDVSGHYRPCGVCAAPAVVPFPADWTIELIKEGPPVGPVSTYFTPHRPDCTAPDADPQPGISVRVQGAAVVDLDVRLPGTLVPRPPTRWANLPDNWVPVGYADGGTISADGVEWVPPGPPPHLNVWAAGDVRAGQVVQFAGPGRLFVKPVVPHDIEGEVEP